MRRVCLALGLLCAVLAAPRAWAGTVLGSLDLPSVERAPVTDKGFLDRIENPLAKMSPYNPTPQMVVVLEGDEKPVSPPQQNWELVGESFSRPVLAVPAGAEVVIKNVSHSARLVAAVEDPKLIVGGLINPTGAKSVRLPDAGKVYTITGGKDAPHLKGKLVVVNTQYIAYPDENGKFQVSDVPPGSYKVRVWYRDGWLDLTDTVEVSAKGRAEVSVKIPATAFQTPNQTPKK